MQHVARRSIIVSKSVGMKPAIGRFRRDCPVRAPERKLFAGTVGSKELDRIDFPMLDPVEASS
jgi:hypothetical protein